MCEKDLLSVIVPVYNVKQYLFECVDSILSQEYDYFECILVDDGSTDGSGEICDNLAKKDSRIVVIHKENGGLSSARNAGVEVSRGSYICFVDSDDMISDNYLKVLYENAKIYNADVSICKFICFWEDEKLTPVTKNSHKKIDKNYILERIMNGGDASKGWSTYLIISCNKLIKKEIAKKISFPVGKWHEDEFYINYLIENAESFVETQAQLYFYRKRSDSITGESNKNDPRHLDAVEAINERKKVCRRVCDRKTYKKIVRLLYKKQFKSNIKKLVYRIGIERLFE